MKILFWDGSGFCIYHKKLAKGTFAWPGREGERPEGEELRAGELLLILAGIDLAATRPRRWHRRAYQESVT